jgi:hypothetical protein
MSGISRQAYYKRQQKVAQLEEERDVLLKLIRQLIPLENTSLKNGAAKKSIV